MTPLLLLVDDCELPQSYAPLLQQCSITTIPKPLGKDLMCKKVGTLIESIQGYRKRKRFEYRASNYRAMLQRMRKKGGGGGGLHGRKGSKDEYRKSRTDSDNQQQGHSSDGGGGGSSWDGHAHNSIVPSLPGHNSSSTERDKDLQPSSGRFPRDTSGGGGGGVTPNYHSISTSHSPQGQDDYNGGGTPVGGTQQHDVRYDSVNVADLMKLEGGADVLNKLRQEDEVLQHK